MILEEKIVKILHEEIPKIEQHIKWDGMYDNIAKRIVKIIKDEVL